MHQHALLTTLAASLAALPFAQAGFYAKSSPVLQVDAKSYDRLIAQSNHTSVSVTHTHTHTILHTNILFYKQQCLYIEMINN
jgi:hypothetical protein